MRSVKFAGLKNLRIKKLLQQVTKHRRLLLIVLGLLLIAYAAFGLTEKYRKTHNPHPLPLANQVVTRSTANPDETPIPPTSAYEVPADQPRQINLPTINAQGFIQKVGLDKNNAIGVPSSIFLAGWFTGGVKPGDTGVALIDGHVSGKYQPGIFKNIKQLKAGSTFSVEFGDHSTKSFEVVSVSAYSVADVAKHMLERQVGVSKQLNLITCGGPFDSKSQQYEQRILVVSKLI